MTADQALAIINNEYALGDGGGQLSTLIDDVMKLRAQGFKPSNANKLAIEDALEHRPNQTPLVEALKATLQYQRKLQAQAAAVRRNRPAPSPAPCLLCRRMPASTHRSVRGPAASTSRSADAPSCSTKNC